MREMDKTVWEKQNEAGMKAIMEFNEGYKAFMTTAKTEREAVREAVKMAEEAGYVELEKVNGPLKSGDKVYSVNRGKNICLFIIGEKPLAEGMNILGAHIDSPRLDIKQNPLYETDGLVLLDTHYYGGIKKYQWVARPLALHGVVCRKDGSVVELAIGEKENDPVLGISDLLPHLGRDQMTKTADKVVTGEDLNALVGNIPADVEKDKVKTNILNMLKNEYGIEEEDFSSAELELVPAGAARDFGLDRSMIMSYGQDDRACAYTSLKAILDSPVCERTSCCILVDKEEIGSVGNTGMKSRYFENTMAELFDKLGEYSELNVRRCLRNSKMISSDVSIAFDPNYPSVSEKKNTAFMGKGICFNKFTGSRGKSGASDANPEFIAQIRHILDDAGVTYQTSELGAVDVGGGGTIAYIMACLDMEVIDAGIPVQSMHAPYEVTSKADIKEAYECYKVFLRDMK